MMSQNRRAQPGAARAIIGAPTAMVDAPRKASGAGAYPDDLAVPGMLHGRVVRPPAMSATLRGFDEASVRDIPGIGKDLAAKIRELADTGCVEFAPLNASSNK